MRIRDHSFRIGITLSAVLGSGAYAGGIEPLVLELVPASTGDWPHLIGNQGFLPGFAEIGFDDAGWAMGATPFGLVSFCGQPAATPWPLNTDLLLRRWVQMPAAGTIRISAAIDNDIQAHLDGVPLSPLVQFEGCADSFRYEVEQAVAAPGVYLVAIRARDRGGDSFLNVQIGAILTADCNGDGIVDYGQILDGTLADVNGNGVPDICECIGDLNTDGVVNGADIAIMLGFWGVHGKPVDADINGDGVVDDTDLALLLSGWGACPSITGEP